MFEQSPKRPECPSAEPEPSQHQSIHHLWFVNEENHLHTLWNLNSICNPRD